MGNEVLSQSQIDALLAKNALAGEAALSPEIEALLTQGRKSRSEKTRVLTRWPEEKPVPLSAASEGLSSSKRGTTSGREVAPVGTRPVESRASGGAHSAGTGRIAESGASGGANSAGTGRIFESGAAGDAVQGSSVKSPNLEALNNPLHTAMSALIKRMEMVEKLVGTAKTIQLEREIANINRTILTLSRSLKTIANCVQNDSSQIRSITRGMNNTLDYNIRETFQCRDCGSKGYVKELVKCSRCGREDWWGW